MRKTLGWLLDLESHSLWQVEADDDWTIQMEHGMTKRETLLTVSRVNGELLVDGALRST